MRGLALVLVAVPALAWAKQPPLHDVPWYASHDRERSVTLQLCRENQALRSASDDCANAQRAETKAAPRGTDRDPLAYLDDPAYYSSNPIFRQGVLNACQHPEDPGNQMFLPHCAAARASAGGGR